MDTAGGCHSANRALLAVALLAIAAPALSAQGRQDTIPPDTVFHLEELRVELSRLRVGGIPLARAPLSAQLLPGRSILRNSNATFADALALLQGVSLSDQVGSPFQKDVRLRGFTVSPVVGVPQSVSVFVDGVRVNEADAAQFNFNLVPMGEIERVEVIRGPVGPFGKNTLAGALNIVTRRGSGRPWAEAELSGGYFEEVRGRARAQGQSGPFDFYGALGFYRSDGWRQKNYAEQRQVFAKVGWRQGDTDFWISYTFAKDSLEGPQTLPRSWLEGAPLPPAIIDPPNDRRKLRFTGGEGDYFRPLLHFVNANLNQRLSDRSSLQVNAFGRFADFTQFNDGLTEPDLLGLTDIKSAGAAVQLGHRRGQHLVATIGAEYVRNDVGIRILELPNENFPAIDVLGVQTEQVGTEEDNLGAFGELWWALTPRFSVHGSLRYDYVNLPFTDFLDPSQSGESEFKQLTGTAGVDYLGPAGFGGFASYGRGFRAPVILEISCADPNDPCPLPFELGADPPLDPVKTDTWQLGVRYSGPFVVAEAVGYWAEVYDDIFNVVDLEVTTRGFFTNLDRTRRQGIELSVSSVPVRDLTLTGTFAWTRATFQSAARLASPFLDDAGNGAPGPDQGAADGEVPPAGQVVPGDKLAMVPDITFTVGSEYAPEGWLVGLNARFVSSQFLLGDEANTEIFGKLDPYVVLDGYIEYGVGSATLYVRGLNLFDVEHESFGVIGQNLRVPPGAEPRIEPFFTPGHPFRLFGGIRYRIQ